MHRRAHDEVQLRVETRCRPIPSVTAGGTSERFRRRAALASTSSQGNLSATHSDAVAAYVEAAGAAAHAQLLPFGACIRLRADAASSIGRGLLLCVLLWAFGTATAAVAQVPSAEVTGTLHVLWGDPPAGSPVLQYLLTSDDGVSRLLDMDESVLDAAGGLLQVNGSRVRLEVDAARTPRGRERVRTLVPLTSIVAPAIAAESQVASALAPAAVTRRYVTILCRFADSVDQLPGTKERYEQLMGAAYPGVNHYWTEVTGGGITLDGSIVVGWYTLPEPRSAYVPAGSGADLTKLQNDCTAAADADVDYPSFHGINLQFNQYLDCCSWGGTRTMTLDGVTRYWATTWEASWAGLGTYAHEVGHSLGLPHSGGPYGNVYDSRYDVMSHSSWYRDPTSNFSMGSHTIGYHKDRLGAIPAARRVVAAGPLTRVALERSALPRANAGAQLVIVPVRDETGEFYTIESRRGGGYDAPLVQGVVIHSVNPRRSEPAQVVDVDGNGNVTDAGAQWVPGEFFRDLRHDITVLIDSVRDEQVHITVLRGERAWLVLAPGTHVHRVRYGSTDSVQDSAALQTSAGLVWQASTAWRRAQVLNPAGAGGAMLRWQRVTRGLAPGVYVDTIRVLSPGASGHLAFAVDSLIVDEPSGMELSLSLSATARSDSVFQNTTGYTDSSAIRFAGTGAATAAWTVAKSRSSTILYHGSSGIGDGVVRWYHWTNALAPGVYVDTLTVSAPGAAGSPVVIIDTLHVHALPTFTVSRFAAGPAIVPEGSTVRDSLRITPTGRWETTGTWTAAYQGTPSHIRLLDPRQLSGSVVLAFERRAGSRAPGMYVDTLRLAPTIPTAALLLIDTMAVEAAPLTLELSWSSRRDSIVAGVAQRADSVLVMTAGPGASTRNWIASVSSPTRITLARCDAATSAGGGRGTAWLRWFHNVGSRAPGWYVDTIRIAYADTALARVLVDSLLVLPPLAATVAARSRSTDLVGGGSSRDSVLLTLFGPGSSEAAWTAQARGDWLELDVTSGTGTAWLKWTRTSGALPIGIHVDTIRVTVADAGGAAPFVIDTLRLIAAPGIAIASAATLRPGLMGAAYADTLRASADGAIAWSVRAGALPSGLTLDPNSGVLGGVPEEAGEFAASIGAAVGAVEAMTEVRLSVTRPRLTESVVIDALVGGAALSDDDARFLDLLGNRNGRVDIGDARAWLRDTGRLDATAVTELQRINERLETAAFRQEGGR